MTNPSSFMKCLFCDKKHKSEKCRIVTEIQARKNILKKKKLCFVCLNAHHVAKDCKSKISCYNCKRDIMQQCVLVKIQKEMII